ncbi:MAG: hypothetical protein LBJ73_02300 [Rickettsiales bacterium]|jgi:hypothetical protein|nr:hypothetical protein [Rickettsiales bacterium]
MKKSLIILASVAALGACSAHYGAPTNKVNTNTLFHILPTGVQESTSEKVAVIPVKHDILWIIPFSTTAQPVTRDGFPFGGLI